MTMPDRLFQRCNEHGCPSRTNNRGGYCDSHKKENWRTRQQKDRGHAWYYLPIWAKLKEAFRSRYPLRACMCQWKDPDTGEMCGRTATVIDHIEPFRGSWELFIGGVDYENFQGMCKAHHNQKTTLERQEVTPDENL
jgi:hypothetical protein